MPPTTKGLSRAWGSSVKVRRPSPDEPVGVVEEDVDDEVGIELCRRALMLLEREGVFAGGP